MKYFIIWIEGISVRRGDKIKSLNHKGHEYTSYMTKAMRVKETDKERVKRWLVSNGITESFITFIKTSYVPKGTLFTF